MILSSVHYSHIKSVYLAGLKAGSVGVAWNPRTNQNIATSLLSHICESGATNRGAI